MNSARTSAVIIVMTLLTAMIGGAAGVNYGLRQVRPSRQLDQVLHEELHLSAAQNQKLATLESQFTAQRARFDADMQAANRDIAAAITIRHAYDEDTRRAIDRLHQAMMGLQQVTVQHVLAMRALLLPEQVDPFDQTVNQALASTPP